MHLLRIQVPDFRVLKDIDITFEKEFVPSIFPLGSQNGGGKSTLLQLIFVLLHCSTEPERKQFIQNMLRVFKIPDDANERVLAILDIWDGDKSVNLKFLSCSDSYIRELFSSNSKNELSTTLEEIKNEISNLENEIFNLELILSILESMKNSETDKQRRKKIENVLQKIMNNLQTKNLIYICNYSVDGNKSEGEVLLCQVDNLDMTKAESFLKELSQKIFLAAPATQVFLFIAQEYNKLLFRNQENANDYYSQLQVARSKLSGFFTYDFLAVDVLIESFKNARDRDFREAVETGEYGTSYKTLLNDLNQMLVNKKIKLDPDLSGVTFNKIDSNGENIELYPEDLSHGELKRLSIYIWLKYRNIENAIVLMDEIEIAFHPDWQYQIISELKQWSPSNQYIIATHSYELCQALTPAHVKEIEPKLLKQEVKN